MLTTSDSDHVRQEGAKRRTSGASENHAAQGPEGFPCGRGARYVPVLFERAHAVGEGQRDLGSILQSLHVDNRTPIATAAYSDPPGIAADATVVDQLPHGLWVEFHLDGFKAVRTNDGHELHVAW